MATLALFWLGFMKDQIKKYHKRHQIYFQKIIGPYFMTFLKILDIKGYISIFSSFSYVLSQNKAIDLNFIPCYVLTFKKTLATCLLIDVSQTFYGFTNCVCAFNFYYHKILMWSTGCEKQQSKLSFPSRCYRFPWIRIYRNSTVKQMIVCLNSLTVVLWSTVVPACCL